MTNNEYAAQQDALRPFRQFISLANGFVNGDQSYAGADGYIGNRPGQFSLSNQYGSAVVGLPISTTQNGGLVLSPVLLLVALGAAAVLLLKRGG